MKVHAPFTPPMVEALKAWQSCGWVHPFTCPNRNDDAHRAYAKAAGLGDTGILQVTRDGWVCPVCGYRQTWAHAHMLELPHRAPWWTP